MKAAMEQKARTKGRGEVFTPYDIVKKMNDTVQEGDWEALKIFIKKRVLEVTCGEAPFLTTRYYPDTGVEIPIKNRVGLLDRKLHSIPGEEYYVYEEGYVECATEALKAVYGYELQYDSLFLARRNVLMTTIEHFVDRFGKEPDYEQVSKWATIISYNLIRMDGLTLCVPKTDIPAMVMDWETGEMETFGEPVKKKGKKRKR